MPLSDEDVSRQEKFLWAMFSIAVVLLIGIPIAVFSPMPETTSSAYSTTSKSYRDGYHYGYNNWTVGQNTDSQVCGGDVYTFYFSYDDPYNWGGGCRAGWAAANG